MTVRTIGQMGCGIDQSISMTGSTVVGSGRRYQAAVIWRRCMDRIPCRTMTGCTVTTRGKTLAVGAVCGYQRTVCLMTAGAIIMNLRITCIGQRWWITVAVSTIRCCYLNQTRMIRLNSCMCCLPTKRMTRLTVTARGKALGVRTKGRYQGTT